MQDKVKQAYLDRSAAQLCEWAAKVEGVKAKIAKESAEVRLQYHAKIADWTERESLFKKKLEELQQAGEQGYESVKTGVQNAWNDITKFMTSIEDKK